MEIKEIKVAFIVPSEIKTGWGHDNVPINLANILSVCPVDDLIYEIYFVMIGGTYFKWQYRDKVVRDKDYQQFMEFFQHK